MAAPEGDYWFYHESLKSNTFDPTDPKQFYTTVWLEVAANWTFLDRTGNVPRIPWEGHPRGGKQFWNLNVFGTAYARHKWMTAMVGRTNKKITRYKKVHGQFARDHLYDQLNETIVALVPVDMPTPEEKYLWVDMTYPLRGIYFPKRHIASPKYKNKCMYSRLSFLERPVTLKTFAINRPAPQGELVKDESFRSGRERSAEIERRKREGYPEEDPPKTLPGDALHEGSLQLVPHDFKGWDIRPQWSVRFDVEVIMHIVSLPADILKPEYDDPFKHVALFDCRWIDLADGVESFTMNFGDHTVDYLKTVQDEKHMKLVLANNGFDKHWLATTVGGLCLVGVSLIPGYGPIAALGGQMLLDLLTAPDEFEREKFAKDRAPMVVAAIITSAKSAKGYILGSALKGAARRRSA
jgi:hypothetical protein